MYRITRRQREKLHPTCGRETLRGSIIAHMFRVTDKPQTHAKYHAEGADVGKNKLRAAKAWMGEFVEKVIRAYDMSIV